LLVVSRGVDVSDPVDNRELVPFALSDMDEETLGLAEELRDAIALMLATSEMELLAEVGIDTVALLLSEGDEVVEGDCVALGESEDDSEAAALIEEERDAFSDEDDAKERDVDREAEAEGVVDEEDCKEGVLMVDNVPRMAVGEALEELVGVGASDAVETPDEVGFGE